MLQRAMIVGKVFLAVFNEAGIVHGCRAVDHGIVVIKHEAFVSHFVLLCVSNRGGVSRFLV
jgi:hypothetical protein